MNSTFHCEYTKDNYKERSTYDSDVSNNGIYSYGIAKCCVLCYVPPTYYKILL